jgi:oligoendopeptidase F
MIDHVEPRHQEITQQLTDKLLAIPYLPPPELEQMFKRLKVDKEIFHPNNIALWQDIFKLASGYSKLNGSVTVNLEGKTMTMAEARTRLLDPDRNLRKNAWKAMQQTSLKIAEEADTIFLQLIPLRQHLAKNIKLDNYRSYIWKGLKRFDYTPQDALDFIRSIEHEVIPILSKSQKVDKS